MRLALGLLLLCSVLFLIAFVVLSPAASDNSAVVLADQHFALDLYAQLDREQPGKNLFFSPSSVSLALAMTAAGARGETETEMTKVLHFDGGPAKAHAYYRQLLEQWNKSGQQRPYELRVANRLWAQRGYAIRSEFLTLTRRQYDAPMQLLDFAESEAARREINEWVEDRTNGKIKELLSPQDIDKWTRLVLTNAIYFKGKWAKQFNKTVTYDRDFTISAEQKVKVPLMQQTAAFGYVEEETFQALEMPYEGNELSMVVLLPRKTDGLPELEKSLSLDLVQSILAKLKTQKVITYIPRFKMTAGFELGSTLKAMGMKRAFSPDDADFTGIREEKGLYISRVIHKAFVEVNEEGTEAAAATAVLMKTGSAPGDRGPVLPEFRADHPFVFLIRDMKSGEILFLGRLVNPAG